MRICFPFFALFAMTLAYAQAHECDAILIPTISSFEHDALATLDTLSIIESNSSLDRSSKDKFDANIPVFGARAQFGFENENSSQFRNRTLNYFNRRLSNHEATSYLNSEVDSTKTQAWADCMQRDTPFVVYFNRQTIRPDAATLWVRRYRTGPPSNSAVRMIIRGGTIDGKGDIQLTTNHIGDQPYPLKRDQTNKRVTVEATMDNSHPSTAIIPEIVPPPKVPDVVVHVKGNLQQAIVDETYPVGQFNFTVTKGVVFDSNQVSLRIEQLVSNRVCRWKQITSSALGDMMDSLPEWRLDNMKVGCQVPNPSNATVVECFMDPVYFTECPR